MDREQLSALMDGELESGSTQATLEWLRKNPDERQTWNEYHLIGDVLRGGDISHVQLGEAISRRLAQEPTLLAPRSQRTSEQPVHRYARWAAVAAAVSVVTLAGWSLQRPNPANPVLANSIPAPTTVVTPSAAPQLAATAPTPARAMKATAAASETSSAEMERFAALHRQFTPLSGFQTVEFELSPKASR